MKIGLHASAIAILWLQASAALATTWMNAEVDDPIAKGKCQVQQPASFGSYIYEWPEKYDQVFWPFTDPNGIWMCSASGFAAFIDDMKLGPEEKTQIAVYLKAHPLRTPKPGIAEKLERLRAIYALRTLDPDRRLSMDRVLAYQYESAGGQAAADGLRRAALRGMAQRLQDAALPARLKMEYLFVSANYAREFGDGAESDRLLTELDAALAAAANDAETADYAAYLKGLLDASRRISPGGKLAP